MEGLLLLPPDRAAILNRSAWKTRFVTLGEAPQAPSQGTSHRSLRINASSLKHLKFGCQNGSRSSLGQASAERGAWLCVYKEKGGNEPITYHPVSSIVSCTIEDQADRKGNTIQPTLVVTVATASASKAAAAEAKTAPASKHNPNDRRLSQTPSLSKSQTKALLFRSPQTAPHSLQDWHDALQRYLAGSISPSSDKTSRPSTSAIRPPLPHSQGSYISTTSSHGASSLSIRTAHTALTTAVAVASTSVHRPKPSSGTFSLSSLVSDHFSAASTSTTAGAGAAAAARPSPSQTPSPPTPPPPPIVRETILDRAFKMNCIPGAKPLAAGETPMNSIARFEALMQDMEARRTAERRPSAIDEDDAEGSGLRSRFSMQRSPSDDLSSGGGGGGSGSGSAAGSIAARSRRHTRRSRPASLALPSNSSIRGITADGAAGGGGGGQTDRRRSSVSTTPSLSALSNNAVAASAPVAAAAAAATAHKRLSLADFTHRLSSSSLILARTTTTTSSRSSAISDLSFHCLSATGTGGAVAGGGGISDENVSAWSNFLSSRSSSGVGCGSSIGGSGGGGGGSSLPPPAVLSPASSASTTTTTTTTSTSTSTSTTTTKMTAVAAAYNRLSGDSFGNI